MITILFRTLVIYFFLIIVMRTMGKRQIGELEVTDLVTTLLISEIAALPITNQDIPVLYALLPMVTLLFLEVASSVVLLRLPRWKGLVSARPTMLIKRGVLDQAALSSLRISMDELVSEVRQQGVRSLALVDYAILEKNGKLTVLSKESPDAPSEGLMHIVLCDGDISRAGLAQIGKDEAWLLRELEHRGISPTSLFCVTANESGELLYIYKDGNR
jgi:uncharacterized membrane protein YcaP (DUF421 family)